MLVHRADELMGCTENSPEGTELAALTDVIYQIATVAAQTFAARTCSNCDCSNVNFTEAELDGTIATASTCFNHATLLRVRMAGRFGWHVGRRRCRFPKRMLMQRSRRLPRIWPKSSPSHTSVVKGRPRAGDVQLCAGSLSEGLFRADPGLPRQSLVR